MKSEAANGQQYEREPFFKRIGSDIADWFVKKGLNIKTKFLTYIKSKETRKIWKRRLIIVGIIVLFILSIRVKEYFRLFPYDESSYLITDNERTTITSYTGNAADGLERLEKFFQNIDGGQSDSIRLAYSVSGYAVYEDLKYDGLRITMEIDQTRNKTLPKAERVKVTKTFVSYDTSVTSSGLETTYLVAEDGSQYLLYKTSLIKT